MSMKATHSLSRQTKRPELAGKFLAVLPTGDRTGKQGDYFFREPLRQSRGAVQQLNFRPLP